MVRKLLGLVLVVLVVMAVAHNPTGCAASVRHLAGVLGGLADGIAQFATGVAGGGR